MDRLDVNQAPWPQVPLESLVDPERGIPYGVVLTGVEHPEGVPTVRCGDIKGFTINHACLKRISPSIEAQYKRTRLQGGEVLIAIRGTVGATAVVAPSMRGMNISREVAMIPVLDGTDPRFLALMLASPPMQRQLLGHVKGVAQAGINLSDLRGLMTPAPPLTVQRRTVDKVETLLTACGHAKDALAEIPKLLDQYRQSILAAAFRGDLTAEWRQQHSKGLEPAISSLECIRIERQARWQGRGQYQEPSNPIFEELPELPPTWHWATAEQCSTEIVVGHVGPMQHRYTSEGIPFLRSLNVRANRFDPSDLKFIPVEFHKELAKSTLRAGDLVIVRTGEPGVACVVPETLPEANCADLVITRLLPGINAHLVAHYMNSHFAKNLVRGMQVGVAQQHFNIGAMRTMPLPLIPDAEQIEVLRLIQDCFAFTHRVEQQVQAARDQAVVLDQAILAKAFRGELVTRVKG